MPAPKPYLEMARKHEGSGVAGLLLGVVLPVVGLFVLFSTTERGHVAGSLPFAVDEAELSAFARLFDRRAPDTTIAVLPSITLTSADGDAPCRDEAPWQVQAEGQRWSATMQRIHGAPQGFRLLPDAGAARIELVPAGPEDIQAAFAVELARHLGMPTPGVYHAMVLRCGEALGVHRCTPMVDQAFLAENDLRGMTILSAGPGVPVSTTDTMAAAVVRTSLAAAIDGTPADAAQQLSAVVDRHEAIALLLLRALMDDDPDVMAGTELVWSWAHGHLSPIHRASPITNSSATAVRWLPDPFTPLLYDEAFRSEFNARWHAFASDSLAWMAALDAVEERWAPVLAEGRRPDHSIAAGLKAAILSRLRSGDAVERLLAQHRSMHGLAIHAAADDPAMARRPVALADSTFDRMLISRFRGVLPGDTIFFPRGKYRVSEDLVFPPDRTLVLERGARFEMEPGTNILVHGPLHVRGTEINPVFIRAVDGTRPFGTFALMGGAGVPCAISGLRVSGGSEALVNGIHHPGMLSITGAEVRFVDVTFGPASQGPALVLRHATASFQECVFWEGDSPQLMMDRVDGQIRDCIFVQRTSTGAAAVVSDGRLLLEGSTWDVRSGLPLVLDHGTQALITRTRFGLAEPAIRLGAGGELHLHAIAHRGSGPLVAATSAQDGTAGQVHLYDMPEPQDSLIAADGLHYRYPDAIDTVRWSAFGWTPPEPVRGRRR